MEHNNKILIACEESQVVTIEMRKLGLEAYSCDIIDCSGKHPEWHIKKDVRQILNDNWKMMIALPPCTHLAVSGASWFKEKQKDGRQQIGIDFFLEFTKTKCEMVAIENPICIMSNIFRKPDQIIHPWQFGHPEQKTTCLWLKGLPKLKPTKNVYSKMMELPKNKREKNHYMPPSKNRSTLRSKTFQEIAKAMAEQWGCLEKPVNFGFNIK